MYKVSFYTPFYKTRQIYNSHRVKPRFLDGFYVPAGTILLKQKNETATWTYPVSALYTSINLLYVEWAYWVLVVPLQQDIFKLINYISYNINSFPFILDNLWFSYIISS